MSITNGQTASASDFITKSEKDATPANDSGRVPQLETDGKLHGFFTKNGQVLNAGATINGATLPVPVYQNKTDNEVYACDANDATKYKFIGFATSDGTDGNSIDVQFSGVVGGFSALDEGEKYYVSDTVGTISNTPGTQEILVGVAISTTEIFIQKGKRYAHGTVSQADAGNSGQVSTTAITLGFRPSKIRIHAYCESGDANDTIDHSDGSWVNGTYALARAWGNGSASEVSVETNKIVLLDGGSTSWNGTITNVTDTGFTISLEQGVDTSNTAYLHWEAEGEL